ncbi:mercury(II) reductase [Sulfitobacter mediterraneus]|uniref:mercury(II) reductase n=1 Tax=Sulfitobacter mediterraneus TaxID=83219 RepID=UPI0019395DD6|nr:mercury(II) reductase [Sulfitobacter mediterraneus]MBM1558577.1 mercury(II) reductase [Sulfitobacter mediterraneus]MBM1569847.1 mercury(II) reductase [Sulfitobacter mediterraneus]MBM1573750.1 mercury(II) reductase [Sulfitobacter mediterraneus]MBM1577578.1 mercury(II) reductase [Sulfitobacter mediterraneus]MBM1581565.1 mercury(II) reductase [Sulfitobacter mediterraneus]
MSDCCSSNSADADTFDLAVIGAGSAGFSAAITAAEDGARVALIGHGTIGGTCVNVGCVPSKAMIRAVETLHSAKTADRFDGVEATAKVTDWAALVAQKKALVDDLRAAKYVDVLPNYESVNYIEGQASFASDGSLEVGDRTIRAPKIIIATGSSPHVPDIPGVDKVDWLDSTSALEQPELPKSLMVMGGGYIGVEIAQIFARAGVEVTIVTRRGLLPEAEPEVSEALTKAFVDEGIKVLDGLSYDRFEKSGEVVTLHATHNGVAVRIEAEKLLLATGRIPNTGSLGLDVAGIDINARGGIVIDPQMRSSRDGVYATGDVTGSDQFVYMAAYGAKLAAKNAINGNTLSYDNSVMPAVVFSDPQVASVGLTEAQAESAGHEVATSVLGLEHVPRALAARDTRGLIKLIADKDTKQLLGAHIIAPEGADSIQTAAMAIKMGMTYDDLGAMIFPYLTTVEGLKLAAQTFDKDVAKLSCCAG